MNEQVKLPVVELVYRRKPTKKYKVESARDAYELLVSPFKDTIEHHISTRIILLNGSNRVLGVSTVSEGALSYNITDVRFILQLAILSNCKGVIICINQPSGDLEPTKLDDELVKQVKIALSYVDIDLLDYILYCEEDYYSYSDNGKL